MVQSGGLWGQGLKGRQELKNGVWSHSPAHAHCQVSKFQRQEISASSAKAAKSTSLGQDGPNEGKI